MSAANVRFLDIEGEPIAAGMTPTRFSFRCVGKNRGRDPRLPVVECGELLIANSGHGIKRDGQGKNGGRPQWDYDGNTEAPTFKPSIDCGAHCGWHGYIRKGRCIDTNGKDEPE